MGKGGYRSSQHKGGVGPHPAGDIADGYKDAAGRGRG